MVGRLTSLIEVTGLPAIKSSWPETAVVSGPATGCGLGAAPGQIAICACPGEGCQPFFWARSAPRVSIMDKLVTKRMWCMDLLRIREKVLASPGRRLTKLYLRGNRKVAALSLGTKWIMASKTYAVGEGQFCWALRAATSAKRRLHGSASWLGGRTHLRELKRQEIDPPIHETVRIPTALSTVPQSKSLGRPLGPEPGAQ